MGKNKRNRKLQDQGTSEQHVVHLIEQRMKRRTGSCDWIKQHKMQQRTIKVEQVFQHFPSLITTPPTGNASVQPFFITANGFSYYNQSGLLVAEKMPQQKILDLSFKCFTYYEVQDISIEFVPNRVQIAIDSSGNQISVHQQPTLANNIPQLDFVSAMVPTYSVSEIDKYYENMSARKGLQMLRGDKMVRMSMQLPSNLLQRQSEPMLRTNFDVATRDLYANDDLNYLVILPNLSSNLSRTPYGTFKYSMTVRLAGRVNPDVINPPPPKLQSILSVKEEEEQIDQNIQFTRSQPAQVRLTSQQLEAAIHALGCAPQEVKK